LKDSLRALLHAELVEHEGVLLGDLPVLLEAAGAPAMARSIALAVSNRLQPMAAALLCLMAAHLIVASCTPEPAPYAARAAILR
jgi:hypothetical protein